MARSAILFAATLLALAGVPTATLATPGGSPRFQELARRTPDPAASCSPVSPGPSAASAVDGSVPLGPMPVTGMPRTFTIGQVARVEEVVALEVLEASRSRADAMSPADGAQAVYSFLVRFSWDGTQPEFLSMSGGYYNAIDFSLRDDQAFEYPQRNGSSMARQPELLFGEVAAGQQVNGWVTFQAPADAAWVELVYSPIADERVFFRVAPADA
jgi:hypothetical protein